MVVDFSLGFIMVCGTSVYSYCNYWSCFSQCTAPCWCIDFSELRRLWWVHINRFGVVVPSVLVIAVKALNRVRGGFERKVPVWRRGRWRSLG